MSKIFEIFGDDINNMTIKLLECADINSQIPSGASIALKPNLVNATRPQKGATTHAEILSGVLEYLISKGRKAGDISVIESTGVGGSTKLAASVCGYSQILDRYGVAFYDLRKDKTRPVQSCDLGTEYLNVKGFIYIVIRAQPQPRQLVLLV